MKKISMKDIKNGMSRKEMKSIMGGSGGGGFCDTCTTSQQCCLDSNNIYFCGTAGNNCANQ